MNEAICIGDFITLVSEDTGGLLSAATESDTVSEVSCGSNKKEKSVRNDASSSPTNRNVYTFEVCSSNKYKAERKLRKLRKANSTTAHELLEAEKEVEREDLENDKFNESQRGRKVYYGQTIQLKSVSTQKYVCCIKKPFPGTEKSLRTVNLSEKNGKPTQFRCVQKMANNASGAVVKDGDSLVIESIKDPEHFLHLISDSSQATKSCGIEIATTTSEFKVCRAYRPAGTGIRTGEIIQIHHRQLESILVAETSESTPSGEVFFRKTSPNIEGQSDPFLGYWQVDVVKSNDGLLHRDNLCRLIHISTQRYLCLDPTNTFRLVMDKSEGWTLFKLQSTTAADDVLQQDSFVNIQNMDGKCWLYPSKDTLQRSRVRIERDSLFLGVTVPTDRVQCRMVESTRSEQKADTFQTRKVESQTLKYVCFVKELAERAKVFLKRLKKSESMMISGNQLAFLVDNMKTIKQMLSTTTAGHANHVIQRYMCESGLLIQMFKVMEQSSAVSDHRLKGVYEEAADLIIACIECSTGEHTQYAIGHLDFCIQEARNKESPMHLKALAIMVELFKNNKSLVGQIKEQHIDRIFEMVKMDGHYLYFKLLETLCMCNGEPLARNQTYIANKLITGDDKQELCYLSYMGEHIGCRENTVYISTNSGKTKVDLQDLNKNEALRLHYHHQLAFFKVLCHGGNTQAIRLLTTELGYITFDLLRLSLMDDSVEPQHRAIYCQLITVMFIEANKAPVFGHVPSVLDFTDLEHQQKPDSQMDTLIQWANAMIGDSGVLRPEQNDVNVFLSAILDMVRSLLLYGYYGNNTIEHEHCIRGVMRMLEGGEETTRQGGGDSEEDLKANKTYARSDKTVPQSGFFMVHISALKIIELFFGKATSVLVSEFVSIFKKEGVTFYMGMDAANHSLQVKSFMQKQAVLYPFDEQNLRCTLLDLAHTDHCELVQVALSTLIRSCSVLERMFEKVKDIQLLESDKAKQDSRRIQTVSSTLVKALEYIDGSRQDEISMCAQELKRLCHLEDETPNPINQMLIQSTGILDMVFQQIDSKNVPEDDVFRLMSAMARDNKSVQVMMFDHFDTLLAIPQLTPEIVEATTEIFKGNCELCMKISEVQVKKLFSLMAKLKLPALMDLLHVLVRPHHGCTLKRNKRLAITNIPIYRSDIFKCLDSSSSERLKILNEGPQQISGLILSVLDFMATCAEDQPSFRDTFCTSIQQVEVQDVLLSSVALPTKLVYLRFYTSVYVSREPRKMLQNDQTWKLIRSFEGVFQSVKENTTTEPGFMKGLSTATVSRRLTMKMEECLTVYLFDGILSFLKALFNGHKTKVEEQCQDDMDNLDATLQTFTTDMIPFIAETPHAMELMKDVLGAVHRRATKPGDDVNYENTINSFDGNVEQLHSEIDSKLQTDLRINRNFQQFTRCWYEFYRNSGTVTSRDSIPAAEASTDIPHSIEFNSLVDCFIQCNVTSNGTNGTKYEDLATICTFLLTSPKPHLQNVEETEMKVKCFQVLRSVLQRETEQLTKDGQSSQRQQGKVELVQNTLVQHGCVDCVFLHIRQGQGRDKVSSQALALLSDLLLYRNTCTQAAILKYVTTHLDDIFFRCTHQILKQGIEDHKDRKNQWTPSSQNREAGQTGAGSRNGDKHVRRCQVEPLTTHGRYKQCADQCGTGTADFKLTTVVKMLGNMAGSQLGELPDILRSQPFNAHSYNLVSGCNLLMTTLYPQLDGTVVDLYIDTVRTLAALVSGNAENQSTVVDGDGIEAINHILVAWEFTDCSMSQVLEVKQANIMLARSLVEMNYDSELESRYSDLPEKIAEQIDTRALVNDISDMSKSSNTGFMGLKTARKKETKFQVQDSADGAAMKELCSQYFLLLSRLMDLTPLDKDVAHTYEDTNLYSRLEKKTFCVELVKDGVLQRHYLTNKLQTPPYYDQREVFLESVDRSTTNTKLRGLVSWSAEWTNRTYGREELSRSPYGNIFIKSWFPLNVLLMLLTLILVTFISFAFSAPGNDTDSVKFRDPDNEFRHAEKVLYVLGSVHILISGLIWTHFLVTEFPTITAISHLATLPRKMKTNVDTVNKMTNWSYRFKENQSETKAFSLRSIYYTVLLLCSIAGTVLDGYFFALHLFHMVVLSSPLQKLFRVMRVGAKFLAMLGLLILAIVYTYGVILFLFFHDYWDGSSNERHTGTLFKTFLSLLHHGLIERTYQLSTTYNEAIEYTAFDLAFFVTVTVVCLYLALGIIVDSFAAIRHKQEYARRDDATHCYICNMKSSDLDQTPGGYTSHIKKDHNLWHYMIFLIGLDHGNPAYMTGLENYVLQKLKRGELDFFPNKMSHSVGPSPSESDVIDRMHQMELRMADIGTRLAKEPEPRPGSLTMTEWRGKQS